MLYTLLLEQIHLLSWNIYFGGILLFSIYSIFCKDQARNISLQFQQFGVLFGLSLGAAILSKLLLHWLVVGNYYPRDIIETIGFSFAFLTWLSNMILEIWTLDPVRKYHKGLLPSAISIEKVERHLLRHIWLHSIILIVVQISFSLR